MASVDYVVAASILGYIEGFATIPNDSDYNTLTWIGTAIPKAALETAYLEMKRGAKLLQLQTAMRADVLSGFHSDALVVGVYRRYDSDLQGQIAVVGATVYCTPSNGLEGATSFTLPSTDLSTGALQFDAHSLAQLRRLLGDLGVFSNTMINRLMMMLGQVMSINTGNVFADLDTIEAFHW